MDLRNLQFSKWLSKPNVALSYKQRNSFEKRHEEGSKARRRRPDLIPIICEKGVGEEIGDLPNHKFLVPCAMTLGEFQIFVRNRIRITEQSALFLFINGNTLVSMGQTMLTIYKQYHEEDCFLYINYGQENTFG